MSLVWEDLSFTGDESIINKIRNSFCACCCSIKSPPILEGLCGSIEIGELTALMGPSGAGKSTLLKCITGGRNYNGCDGKIMVGVHDEVRACFITQDEKDHLLMNLTVVESLRYACTLKNSHGQGRGGKVIHDDIINQLLQQLSLNDVKNNLVENCSGGQKKRLAIGLELTAVDRPNYLFLDEPTSGLDSFAGFQVVQLLRQLAINDDMAIVTTIHQPSYQMILQFHNIYVLTKAGKCIYSGPSSQLAGKLELIAKGRLQEHDNPCDIIIEVASKDDARNRNDQWYVSANSEPEADIRLIEDDIQICNKMTEGHIQNMRRRRIRAPNKEIQEDGICKNNATFSFWNLWHLWCRTCKSSIWRQKRFILIRFTLHALVAVVLAALYNRQIGIAGGCFCLDPYYDTRNCSCIETEEKIKQETITSKNVKFQFFSLLFLMFAALMPTVLTFPAEIKIFLNEHRNGWYTTFSYYFSKTIAEIPLQFVFPFFYTYFLYWYTQQLGMEEWYEGFFGFMTWRYAYFLGFTIISCFIAQGLGFLIGILCVDSFNITIIVSSSMLLFLFLFSGFFVKTAEMAASVEWITYLSFIRFSFEAILITLYGFDRCGFAMDYGSNNNRNMTYETDINFSVTKTVTSPPVPLQAQIPTVPIVLVAFDLKDEDLLENLIWLVVHLIVLRILAFIVLKIRADPKCFLNFGAAILCATCTRLFDKLESPTMAKIIGFTKLLGSFTFIIIKWAIVILIIQMIVGGIVLLVN